MKNLCRRLPVVALVVAVLAAWPAGAQQKGAMQIGLAGRYAWPGMDMVTLDAGFGYGVVFHYYLTSTTSVDGSLDYMPLAKTVDAPGGGVGLDYTQWSLAVGMRYRPKLDLLLRPYVEGGAGYEFWFSQLDLSGEESRSGSSMIYYAGLGGEWEFVEDFTLSVGSRYYYVPLAETMADEVVKSAAGPLKVRNTDLVNASLMTAGIELTWRFK